MKKLLLLFITIASTALAQQQLTNIVVWSTNANGVALRITNAVTLTGTNLLEAFDGPLGFVIGDHPRANTIRIHQSHDLPALSLGFGPPALTADGGTLLVGGSASGDYSWQVIRIIADEGQTYDFGVDGAVFSGQQLIIGPYSPGPPPFEVYNEAISFGGKLLFQIDNATEPYDADLMFTGSSTWSNNAAFKRSVTIDTNLTVGRVGIGTNSPQAFLHVLVTNDSNAILIRKNKVETGLPIIQGLMQNGTVFYEVTDIGNVTGNAFLSVDQGTAVNYQGPGIVNVRDSGTLGFTAGAGTGESDTAWSRLGAARMALGNGSQGNIAGSLTASNINLAGKLIVTNQSTFEEIVRVNTNLVVKEIASSPAHADGVSLFAKDIGGKTFLGWVTDAFTTNIISVSTNGAAVGDYLRIHSITGSLIVWTNKP